MFKSLSNMVFTCNLTSANKTKCILTNIKYVVSIENSSSPFHNSNLSIRKFHSSMTKKKRY